MKVSKAQASANRDAVLKAAAEQIREKGLSGVGVADIAKAAGLTHGALYRHFGSKDELKEAAITRAFADKLCDFAQLSPAEFLSRYLSGGHSAAPAWGCPVAALATEVWREPLEIRSAFRDGADAFITLVADTLAADNAAPDRDEAITIFATLVGAVALSRAVRGVDEAEADRILRVVAARLEPMIGRPATDVAGPS